MIFLVVAVLAWAFCGYLEYGYYLGSLTHEFPYMNNSADARTSCIFGPVSLAATWIIFDRLYWLNKPRTLDERWDVFKMQFPYTAALEGKDGFEQRYP